MAVILCGTAFASPVPAAPPQPPGQVGVRNGRLVKDGLAWVPHGFHQIAFVAPPGAANTKPFFVIAAQNYSPQEYVAMRAAGADSVRIQVSQPGMDRNNKLSTPWFRDRVIGAVRAARLAGLIVIVSMQDEPQSGETHSAELPNAATRHAWDPLAQAFGEDRGVLFELFNEPRPAPSQQNWAAWADAMQETIQHVRSGGSRNVLIADGLAYAERLDGAPRLSDPLDQVVYAAHPYIHSDADQKVVAWKAKFGDFAQTAPVIVTEWSTAYYCNARTPTSAVRFLQYLRHQGTGLEAATWDWQPPKFASAVYNFPQDRFSTFQGPAGELSCGDPGFGFGKTVEHWYRTGVPPDSAQ